MSLAQVLWGAIGWSVGAAFGAAVAARERKEEGRTILFGTSQECFPSYFTILDSFADS